jgi:hypothetical protein
VPGGARRGAAAERSATRRTFASLDDAIRSDVDALALFAQRWKCQTSETRRRAHDARSRARPPDLRVADVGTGKHSVKDGLDDAARQGQQWLGHSIATLGKR